MTDRKPAPRKKTAPKKAAPANAAPEDRYAIPAGQHRARKAAAVESGSGPALGEKPRPRRRQTLEDFEMSGLLGWPPGRKAGEQVYGKLQLVMRHKQCGHEWVRDGINPLSSFMLLATQHLTECRG